jgi:hypothetical protein
MDAKEIKAKEGRLRGKLCRRAGSGNPEPSDNGPGPFLNGGSSWPPECFIVRHPYKDRPPGASDTPPARMVSAPHPGTGACRRQTRRLNASASSQLANIRAALDQADPIPIVPMALMTLVGAMLTAQVAT